MCDNKNVVNLYNWTRWPVCCPFCGCKSYFENDFEGCSHYLYEYASGEFQFLAYRVAKEASIPIECLQGGHSAGIGGYLDSMDSKKHGDYEYIVSEITSSEKFPNYVEFQIDTPSDLVQIGYAANAEELSFWGQVGECPWDDEEG